MPVAAASLHWHDAWHHLFVGTLVLPCRSKLIICTVQIVLLVSWPRCVATLQVQARIKATDLHTVTPSSFLEVSGATLHALSYQQVSAQVPAYLPAALY